MAVKFLRFYLMHYTSCHHQQLKKIPISTQRMMQLKTQLNVQENGRHILAHTAAAASVEEADIYQCLIQYFKSLLHSGKGQDKLNSLLYHMFGCDRLRDPAFLYFIATQLSTNYSNFKKSIETWFDGGMKSRQTSCSGRGEEEGQVWLRQHECKSDDCERNYGFNTENIACERCYG